MDSTVVLNNQHEDGTDIVSHGALLCGYIVKLRYFRRVLNVLRIHFDAEDCLGKCLSRKVPGQNVSIEGLQYVKGRVYTVIAPSPRKIIVGII